MTTPADEAALDGISELVLECLDRMERDGSAALDQVCTEHPEHAEALRARLTHLLDAGLVEVDTEFEVPERLGDFRLGACLGGGGMGLVYAATQESLSRRVALKLIRPEQLFFPESRERFRREVAAIARLGHPGIVPVYTVGEESGLPYFAMELIEGATLAELLSEVVSTRGDEPAGLQSRHLTAALEAVRQRRAKAEGRSAVEPVVTHAAGSTAGASDAGTEAGAESSTAPDGGTSLGSSWVDACLSIGAQVARALEHAHTRGVLHRDLKPSNVMLTPDARALLFDFGLASTAGVTRMTRTGSQVGSLPYMAPEQLSGDQVDARTDVYGLGALLCELLTFTPPQGARRGEELIQAILLGEPVSLRTRRPELPRDAETVILKALEHDPARRYATVGAFGRDLENVLARRPIDARRAGLLVRAARWGQRHPARAVAVALGLALAVGIPTSVAIERGAANETIRQALDDTEKEWTRAETALAETRRERERTGMERDRAEANLSKALVALDTFLHETGRAFLGDIPGMEEARLTLLEQAEALLEELMPQQPGDPVMLARWGEVQRSKADSLELLGRLPEAVEHYRAQLEVLETLRAAEPDSLAHLAEQVGCLNNLGNALSRQGDDIAGLQAMTRARDLIRSEVDASQDLRELSIVERNIAYILVRQQRFDEAHVAYEAAVTAAAGMLERATESGDPEVEFEARRAHALAVSAHALLYRDTARPAAAWPLYEQSLSVLLKQAAARPEQPLLVDEAANVVMNAGATLTDLGEWADAEELLRYGLGLSERLARDFPHSPRYVRTLAGISSTLGFVMRQLGRSPEEIEVLWARAVDTCHAVLERFPEDYDVRETHVMACLNLSSHLVGLERRVEAIAPAADGVVSADLMLTRRPDDPRMRWCAAWLRIEEAYGHMADDDAAAGQALIDQALEILPEDPRVHVAAAEVLAIGLQALEGDAAEAQAARAFEQLELGVSLGYDNIEKLETTGELGTLREHPGFAALLERARAGAQP